MAKKKDKLKTDLEDAIFKFKALLVVKAIANCVAVTDLRQKQDRNTTSAIPLARRQGEVKRELGVSI